MSIVKNAVGGNSSFTFISRRWATSAWRRRTVTAQQNFTNLIPASTAWRAYQAGWDLTVATRSARRRATPASIDLGAGEMVTCAFVNMKHGSIVVQETGDGRRWQLRLTAARSWAVSD